MNGYIKKRTEEILNMKAKEWSAIPSGLLSLTFVLKVNYKIFFLQKLQLFSANVFTLISIFQF